MIWTESDDDFDSGDDLEVISFILSGGMENRVRDVSRWRWHDTHGGKCDPRMHDVPIEDSTAKRRAGADLGEVPWVPRNPPFETRSKGVGAGCLK